MVNLCRHLEFCLAWLRGANVAIFDDGVGQMLGQFLKQCQRQKLLLLHWHMQEQLGACKRCESAGCGSGHAA